MPYHNHLSLDDQFRILIDMKLHAKNQLHTFNASKRHVLLSTDKQVHVNICTAQIENMQNEKLLGVKVLQLILN